MLDSYRLAVFLPLRKACPTRLLLGQRCGLDGWNAGQVVVELQACHLRNLLRGPLVRSHFIVDGLNQRGNGT